MCCPIQQAKNERISDTCSRMRPVFVRPFESNPMGNGTMGANSWPVVGVLAGRDDSERRARIGATRLFRATASCLQERIDGACDRKSMQGPRNYRAKRRCSRPRASDAARARADLPDGTSLPIAGRTFPARGRDPSIVALRPLRGAPRPGPFFFA